MTMTRSLQLLLSGLLAALAATGCGSGKGSGSPPPSAAQTLAVTSQPAAGVAGEPLAAVVVEARDASGAPAPFPGDVTLSLAAGPPGAALLGTTTVTPSGASASFTGLSLQVAGGHQLRVTSGALQVDGAAFEVAPGPPSAATSTLAGSPTAVEANGTAAIVLTATVRDAYGNAVPGATVALSGDATLVQPGAPTDAAGVATGSASSTVAGDPLVAAHVGGVEVAKLVVHFTSADRDGDGVPNTVDTFPDDPTRFARFVTVPLDRLGGAFGAATAVNDGNLVVGLSGDGLGGVQGVRWTVSGTVASGPVALAPLAGNAHSAAYAVDATGAAVGESAKGSTYVPVLWAAGATTPAELSLGALSPPAAAYGISGGQIVGEATGAGATLAVLWTAPDAAPTILPSLGGARSAAYGVSLAAGLAVGVSSLADGTLRGAVWPLDGSAGPIALAPLPGHARSIALAVEEGGRIVGESETEGGEVHAVAWSLAVPNAPVALGPGSAAGVNAGGRVAGHAGLPAGPALWDLRNPSLIEGVFEPPFTFQLAHAYGVNAGDVVVGLLDAQGFAAVPSPP